MADEQVLPARAGTDRTLHRTTEKTGDWPCLRDWALDVIHGHARSDQRHLPELLAILLAEPGRRGMDHLLREYPIR